MSKPFEPFGMECNGIVENYLNLEEEEYRKFKNLEEMKKKYSYKVPFKSRA